MIDFIEGYVLGQNLASRMLTGARCLCSLYAPMLLWLRIEEVME